MEEAAKKYVSPNQCPQKAAAADSAIVPEVKLYFADGSRFFGPGPYALLGFVQKTGSLSMACREMGLSYSKGWKMIAGLEERMGCAIVEKSRGGAAGGRSAVTPAGLQLMARYAAFTEEVAQLAEKIFGYPGQTQGAP